MLRVNLNLFWRSPFEGFWHPVTRLLFLALIFFICLWQKATCIFAWKSRLRRPPFPGNIWSCKDPRSVTFYWAWEMGPEQGAAATFFFFSRLIFFFITERATFYSKNIPLESLKTFPPSCPPELFLLESSCLMTKLLQSSPLTSISEGALFCFCIMALTGLESFYIATQSLSFRDSVLY